MTLYEARSVIQGYLHTNWTDTPIVWENVQDLDFASPTQTPLLLGQDPFISLEIFVHNSQTITVPGHCIRYPGTLEFGVFTKTQTGGHPGDQLVDTLIGLFENKGLGSAGSRIRVRNIVTTVKYRIDSNWYVHRISFAFQFERFIPNP